MTKRDRYLEISVSQYMTTLRPMLVSFAFLHRKLSSCHPEDFEEIRIQERSAALRVLSYMNKHELMPQYTPVKIEAMVLDWFRRVALKEMPKLEKEIQKLIDLENFSRIVPYQGENPVVPEEELAEGFDFSWGLRAAGT